MNVENLQKLYRVGQKILRKRLPFGFGSIDCGSFACLAGWYGRETGQGGTHVWMWGESIFGIDTDTHGKLFDRCSYRAGHPADEPTSEAYAELERRMEYLADLIRKAGGTVPGERSGLPDSVRQIFTEVAA